MKKLTKNQIQKFQDKIYTFYKNNSRSFEWRKNITPYRIVVSEIMLQQTQTSRVIIKFAEWIAQFPDFYTLAQASKQQVLLYWQGLGYNRRGLALHALAQQLTTEFEGKVPKDPETLQTFKGIGPNTAGSICAFAFNKPVVFIETNLRTIFIHEFFKDQEVVHDKELLSLIEQTLDKKNPRDWYYALMDYGVFLKKEHKLSNKKSKHYAKQSRFEGSKRQVRGAVVAIISKHHMVTHEELLRLIAVKLPKNEHDVKDVVSDLQKDGFVKLTGDCVTICS